MPYFLGRPVLFPFLFAMLFLSFFWVCDNLFICTWAFKKFYCMTIQGWDSMILFYIRRMIVEWSCQISKADDGLFKIIMLF